MRRCCGWRRWSVPKFETIARLNIRRPNMAERGLMYLKQNWKWILARLWKSETIVSYIGSYEYPNQGFCGGSSTLQPPCYSSLVCSKLLLYFIGIYGLRMPQSLSSNVSDKNRREKQNKNKVGVEWSTQWKWHGMWEVRMTRKDPVVRWKISRLLLGVMGVKLARLIVTFGRDWGVQAPWELLPFKL